MWDRPGTPGYSNATRLHRKTTSKYLDNPWDVEKRAALHGPFGNVDHHNHVNVYGSAARAQGIPLNGPMTGKTHQSGQLHNYKPSCSLQSKSLDLYDPQYEGISFFYQNVDVAPLPLSSNDIMADIRAKAVDRRQRMQMNINRTRPTDIARNFKNYYLSLKASKEGKAYVLPPENTVIVLRWPVTNEMLEFIWRTFNTLREQLCEAIVDIKPSIENGLAYGHDYEFQFGHTTSLPKDPHDVPMKSFIKKEEGLVHSMNDTDVQDAFEAQVLYRGTVEPDLFRSTAQSEPYLVIKGTRKDWWAKLGEFFGDGDDAVWFMEEALIVLEGGRLYPALRAKRHFPEERINEAYHLQTRIDWWKLRGAEKEREHEFKEFQRKMGFVIGGPLARYGKVLGRGRI